MLFEGSQCCRSGGHVEPLKNHSKTKHLALLGNPEVLRSAGRQENKCFSTGRSGGHVEPFQNHSKTKHLALLGIPDVLRCARIQEKQILF